MRPQFFALLLAFAVLGRAEKLPLKIYTAAEGLAHNSVNRIVRDSHGYLWFCTSEGLSRFDGYEFHNYGRRHGLPHRLINDVVQRRSGEIWMARSEYLNNMPMRTISAKDSRWWVTTPTVTGTSISTGLARYPGSSR